MKNETDETVTENRTKIFKELDKTEISSAANMRCSSVCLSRIMSFTIPELSMFLINTKNVCFKTAVFIPLITVLRNAAINSLKYRRELSDTKNPQHFWEQSYGFSELIFNITALRVRIQRSDG